MAYRSSGNNNRELINNLRSFGIVSDSTVYQAFLRVDRGDFVPPAVRLEAYYDQPLLHGKIHMSAPHIYGTVVSSLDLQPGQSFLNVGSGTGYLSTVAGCLLGGTGINHGVDVDADLIAHARACHDRFLAKADEQGPMGQGGVTRLELFHGNIMSLDEGPVMRYDRIYVGAACPPPVKDRLLRLLTPGTPKAPGGMLIGPMGDELVRVTRVSEDEFTTAYLAAVRFAPLKSQPSVPLSLPKAIWAPTQHHTFPTNFRVAVKCLLMAANREDHNLCARLPRSVWMEVTSFMDRQWFNTVHVAKARQGLPKDDGEYTATAEEREDEEGSGKRSRLRLSIGRRLAERFPALRTHLWPNAEDTPQDEHATSGESSESGSSSGSSSTGSSSSSNTMSSFAQHMLASILLGLPPMLGDSDSGAEDDEDADALYRHFLQNHYGDEEDGSGKGKRKASRVGGDSSSNNSSSKNNNAGAVGL